MELMLFLLSSTLGCGVCGWSFGGSLAHDLIWANSRGRRQTSCHPNRSSSCPAMARRRRPLTTLLLALPLMPLPGGAAPAAGLQGSHWQLLEIQSMDDGQGPRRPPADQPVTMALLAGGQARLLLPCNRAMGTWRLSPSADPG
ncbi:MAG: hypothetical protein ACKO0M_04150, partial [Cyanobium sp.]